MFFSHVKLASNQFGMDNFAPLSVSLLRNAHLFKTPGLFSNSQHSSTFFLFTVKLSFAYRFEHVNFHFTLSGFWYVCKMASNWERQTLNKPEKLKILCKLLGFLHTIPLMDLLWFLSSNPVPQSDPSVENVARDTLSVFSTRGCFCAGSLSWETLNE